MKQSVSFGDFLDRFNSMGRENSFSYEGKKALFEYIEAYEEAIGEEIELDIIALCVEYTEYEDVKEYLEHYSSKLYLEDFDGDEEQFNKAVLEEIGDKTQLIQIEDSEGFIILDY